MRMQEGLHKWCFILVLLEGGLKEYESYEDNKVERFQSLFYWRGG